MEQQNSPRLSGEFVVLYALMFSLVALSIDTMLPVLQQIGGDLGVQRANDNQLIISTFLIGFAAGQLLYGPLSDSIGRKPAICAGLAVYLVGCMLSASANSFTGMLAGRLLQGFGTAGPRIVMVAVIRDQYRGRVMARVMSIIMGVFILVPAVAPAIGQGVAALAGWKAIFYFFMLLSLVTLPWFLLRQPETLPPDRRASFSAKRIGTAALEVLRNRTAAIYIAVLGFVFGAFLGFLNSAQQLLQIQYGLGEYFPLYFAACALSVGASSLINARLVMRFGMRPLVSRSLAGIALVSGAFLVLALLNDGHPSLVWFSLYLWIVLFLIGMLFGNLNAIAMEPLGHIAGIGAALIGAVSTLVSLPLGVAVGHSYNGTVIPLVTGFAVLSALSVAVMRLERHADKEENR